MKYLVTTLLLILFSSTHAQEVAPFKQRELGISIGVRQWKIHEQRFSSRIKNTALLHLGIHHERRTDASRFYVSSQFGFNMSPSSGVGVRYAIINPDINMTYQRRAANIWLGPTLTHHMIVNLPSNTAQAFNNNPVSYTGVTGLGIAGNYDLFLADDKIRLNTGVQTNLISHVIRPAYAHPYPEDFLREEVFDPTRAGIAKSVVRSGKIRSFKGLQSIRVSFGFSYLISDQFKVGITYQGTMLRVNEVKSLNAQSQDVLFTISHVY